jgi:aspartyl-tRNA(Asn)/glutamyl-tRNA(Gln) amidotransferase subunit B
MARTVAEIDGDSSGLVGALDKGRDGMAKMEASGKKLSDQLKEVADKADQAAGAIVGAVMKATRGQADAAKVRALLLERLGVSE